jgi:hypothetical protein
MYNVHVWLKNLDIFETYSVLSMVAETALSEIKCYAKFFANQTAPPPPQLKDVLPHFVWQHYLHHLEKKYSMDKEPLPVLLQNVASRNVNVT